MLKTCESATTRGVVLQFSPGYNLRIPATFRYQTHLISSSTTVGGINVQWSNEEIEFTRDNREKAAISFCSDQLQSSTIQQSCHDPPALSRRPPSSANHPRMRGCGFLHSCICLGLLCIEWPSFQTGRYSLGGRPLALEGRVVC